MAAVLQMLILLASMCALIAGVIVVYYVVSYAVLCGRSVAYFR